MKRRDKNSYWNVAARRLLRVQREIASAKAEGGIVGICRQRLAESTLEYMRFSYGQPSALDHLWQLNRYKSVDSGLTYQGVPLYFDVPDDTNVVTYT